ncbi:MAG TPA: amylo-alpha-1,6-glucosidase [Gemmataceae bacterium]|nr:amylo-alpha-1,6-glucosidase [Gemmataceae bacterium]
MSASFIRQAWHADQSDRESLLSREWLLTNGLGGYASGTIAGAATRRFHGLLIANHPAPLGRIVMLNHLSELVRRQDGNTYRIGAEEFALGGLELHGIDHLTEFRLEAGLPVWRYDLGGLAFEKRLFMPHLQNTVHVHYRLVAGEWLRLKLRPSVHFRGHDAPVSGLRHDHYSFKADGNRYELALSGALPPLKLFVTGKNTAFTLDGKVLPDILYRVEKSRGYDARGELWTPGYFRADLTPENDLTLIASTENWETILAMTPLAVLDAERVRRSHLISSANAAIQEAPAAEWVLAADQFLIKPVGRIADSTRAQAAGDEARTVIAGYHWFTDWGRDTMISLEGLTLTTGRHLEAGYILRTFGHYVRDGLIPNLFPEGEKEGLYHTADASLWFFHALDRYLAVTDDGDTLRLLIPRLKEIVENHQRGTRFGIGVDPADGLLRQGAEGFQLTWMDAKVGDWVVTPRRGKAVEINALWFNALKLLEGWIRQEEGDAAARPLSESAERARRSFNERFWCAEKGHLFDVIDGEHGDDSACRPNQLFALSLPHAILEPRRWNAVLNTVRDRLLTPYGLRSLAPGERDYKAKYDGDLRARDAAYHQGTVWAWLIGPFIDAWLRVHPGEFGLARRFLESFANHLGEACVGSISEIFDAQKPFTPRGCIAQAWSVAEVLRCWVKTANT